MPLEVEQLQLHWNGLNELQNDLNVTSATVQLRLARACDMDDLSERVAGTEGKLAAFVESSDSSAVGQKERERAMNQHGDVYSDYRRVGPRGLGHDALVFPPDPREPKLPEGKHREGNRWYDYTPAELIHVFRLQTCTEPLTQKQCVTVFSQLGMDSALVGKDLFFAFDRDGHRELEVRQR